MAAAKALDLHARLIARDERALAEFVELAAPWLLGVSEAILQDADDAEEVVQEAITVVWNRVGTVREDPRGLMAWALRVVRNRAIDRLRARRRWFRKARRLVEALLDPVGAVRASEIDEAGTPGWHVHRSVHAALDGLPPDQRLVVQLAYFHGLTHSEIARRLELPIGTVKTRLSLAYEKLRRALAPMKDWIV